ncbi:hypothetical protein QBC46DRAFT_394971 [Diplogelasinospora grovesii]|uniref:Uncharacterized protein n=1 Tax=Diplogelasinospora grovesii TaxID=303347 RepID=A0AAN6N333_9PEZI|nr:hypothetical protein QBC46DRAFT_394971 [Diplogelasinospora grovesii]
MAAISNLVATCQTTNCIISSYEQSLLAGKISQHYGSLSRPSFGSAVFLTAAPACQRFTLPPNSFALMRELDRRDRRIEELFTEGSLLMAAISSDKYFGTKLSPQQRFWYLQGLKRACKLLDRLGDCALDAIEGDRQLAPWAQRIQAGDSVEVENMESLKDFIAHSGLPGSVCREVDDKIRKAQIKLLRSRAVSAEDLAFLSDLVKLAGMAYGRANADLESPDDNWEMAFKEALLRYGTCVLGAFLGSIPFTPTCPPSWAYWVAQRGSSSEEVVYVTAVDKPSSPEDEQVWASNMALLVEDTRTEILRFEEDTLDGDDDGDDEGGYDGLHMAMVQEFKKKIGGLPEEKDVWEEMFAVVRMSLEGWS